MLTLGGQVMTRYAVLSPPPPELFVGIICTSMTNSYRNLREELAALSQLSRLIQIGRGSVA
jgi:hypothetical protein